jgi:predicted nuclease of predicted toxin-antitoxin system
LTIWLDAQLPPALCPWLSKRFSVDAVAVRDLGLRHASDAAIFDAARGAQTVVLTKDADFVTLQDALSLVQAGEPLVEIRGRTQSPDSSA